MERCPNCRARWDESVICRRCGIELAKLIEVKQAAERLTRLGVAHLTVGDAAAARDDLSRALGLRREPFAEMLLGFTRRLEVEG